MDEHISGSAFSSTNKNKRNLATDAPLKVSKEKSEGLTRNNSIGWQQPNRAQPTSKDFKNISIFTNVKKTEVSSDSSTAPDQKNLNIEHSVPTEEIAQPTESIKNTIKNNNDSIPNRRNRRFRNPSSKLGVSSLENVKLPVDFELSDIEYLPKPSQDTTESLDDFLQKPLGEILDQKAELDPCSSESQLLGKSVPKFMYDFEKEISASYKEEVENISSEFDLDFKNEDIKLPVDTLYFKDVETKPIRFIDDLKDFEELSNKS